MVSHWLTRHQFGHDDGMRKGPAVTSADIFNYFELSLGADGAAMKFYKIVNLPVST